jgi:hypothetical protein
MGPIEASQLVQVTDFMQNLPSYGFLIKANPLLRSWFQLCLQLLNWPESWQLLIAATADNHNVTPFAGPVAMGLVGKNWGTLSIDASGLSGRSPPRLARGGALRY